MAQRLVRVNCTDCIDEERVDAYARRVLDLDEDEHFRRGAGCYKCHYTGYRGRAAVVELLPITPEIQELIIESRPAREIVEVAKEQGMQTLAEAALDLARRGVTSIEEVYALYTER